ncbi:MAG: NAD(P)-dependent dehydrogenase (short-subunit alcohol dehydrogenase family) [Flavobacteriales bacterium]|jgi:NAD(P)-dependent dehydrogenase (short-subunit alcohol dehydrogenase family)
MKTILITGAGSGIGRAAAIELSTKKDIRLIINGRTIESLEETKSQLSSPKTHLVLASDISKKEAFAADFQKLNPGSLNLAGIFANAGIGGENSYGSSDRWQQILDTNLTGTYNSIMEVLPYLKNSEEEYKNIVITSSCLARFGVPNYTAYCTSKAGLLGLNKALAVELAGDKIKVNAIAPGWIDTEMAREGIQKLADRSNDSFDEALAEQMGYVPAGKMGDPEEVARLVSFLMTNVETSFTGHTFDINNGAFMN